MKIKYLTTIYLMSFTFTLLSQDFGSVGTQWYYSEHAAGSAPSNSEYLHYSSVKDTNINGVTTHKIIRTYYKHTGKSEQFDPLYVFKKSDTAYLFNFVKSKFQAIYIFNAKQGDTLTFDFPEKITWTTDTTYRLVIDTVETVYIDGIPLKRYKTKALDLLKFNNNGGYFMDRIGGLDWFFPRPTTIPEAGGPIRCFSDNQIDTSFQPIACDFRIITSVNSINLNDQVILSPNPFQNQLNIQSELPIEKIELYDLTGKKLLISNELKLNLTSFNNGVYNLTIYLKSGQKIERKIIKQL